VQLRAGVMLGRSGALDLITVRILREAGLDRQVESTPRPTRFGKKR